MFTISLVGLSALNLLTPVLVRLGFIVARMALCEVYLDLMLSKLLRSFKFFFELFFAKSPKEIE